MLRASNFVQQLDIASAKVIECQKRVAAGEEVDSRICGLSTGTAPIVDRAEGAGYLASCLYALKKRGEASIVGHVQSSCDGGRRREGGHSVGVYCG